MAGRMKAVKNGEELQRVVVDLAEDLGLKAEIEVKVGRRIWGAKRRIDVVLTDTRTGMKLGIECKYQGASGTAEEKIPSTIQDIKAWPIKGIVVIAGPGFSDNMRGFLISTGIVVDFEDLKDWLRLYFSL
ncbi:PD-(D/E)XK nuclease superfamily protein [Fibrobacterota bacterium]